MRSRPKKLCALLAALALTACTNALPERVSRNLAPAPLPAAAWLGTSLLGAPSGQVQAKALGRGADGFLYQAGTTNQPLDGQPLSGTRDAFLTKYSADGTKLWTRLLGGASSTLEATAVKADPSGNVYIAGYAQGDLDGQTALSSQDAYLVKYDPAGTKLWAYRVAAPGGAALFRKIVIDALGNVFAVGGANGDIDGHVLQGVSDLLLVKIDPFGNRVWSALYGVPGAGVAGQDLTLDGTDIVVTGHSGAGVGGEVTPADPGNVAAFLLRFDSLGNQTAARMFGGAGGNTSAAAIARDPAGNFYVTGNLTSGVALDGETDSGGTGDGYVTSYSPGFVRRWTRQFGAGPGFNVQMTSIVADAAGNPVAAGYANGGAVNGEPAAGVASALLLSYSGAGALRHTKLFADAGAYAVGYGLAADAAGACYLTGIAALGAFDSRPLTGTIDAFLAKVAPDGSLQ
jgi:hypothetical protein